MGEHAIEFKAWHVGTQFIVDESHLINQIKMMMQSSDQTKVKVRLDKTSLKLTKITTIPLIGSEKKIPLSDIKNIYTDSTFPLCFFCAVSAHDGHLLKIIVIRCNKEMCATGIVNYFRTLTYNRRLRIHTETKRSDNSTSEKVPSNVQSAFASTANYRKPNQTATYEKSLNNGDLGRNGNKETEKIKLPSQKAEFNGALKTEKLSVPAKDDKIGTQENGIKMSSKEVEKSEKQPAVISNHEHIDVHKQDIRSSDKYSRNSRHYSVVNAQPGRGQLKNPKNTFQAYPTGHNRYVLVNNEGKYFRARAHTINITSQGNTVNTQTRERQNFVSHSDKKNEDMRSATLPRKSEVTPETPEVSGPVPGKGVAPAESEEPIYATVVKNRGNKEGNQNSNGDAKLRVDNSDNVHVVKAPPSPRTVTFRTWSTEMQKQQSQKGQNETEMQKQPSQKGQNENLLQKRQSHKGQNENLRPVTYYQHLQRPVSEIVSLNTYVHKPIEKVYKNSTSLTNSWKVSGSHRPRINSNTFKDDKQLVALYRESF